jgi:hypothetical protein
MSPAQIRGSILLKIGHSKGFKLPEIAPITSVKLIAEQVVDAVAFDCG